jgi:hypothetical protein
MMKKIVSSVELKGAFYRKFSNSRLKKGRYCPFIRRKTATKTMLRIPSIFCRIRIRLREKTLGSGHGSGFGRQNLFFEKVCRKKIIVGGNVYFFFF